MTIQQQINALKKEFADKIAELEKQAKAEEKQSKVWKPKDGEEVYILTAFGFEKIEYDAPEDNLYPYPRGAIVKTEEEAEWADEHRIVATELKHFVAENDPRPITEEDWKENNIKVKKYFIFYDFDRERIYFSFDYACLAANQVYASSIEVLQKAIEHIGEERLKKYYFGVKE